MDPEVDSEEAPPFDYPPTFRPDPNIIRALCQMLTIHSSWVKRAIYDLNNTDNADAVCAQIFQIHPRFEEVIDDDDGAPMESEDERKDDPKMVFVVNREHQMSPGKTASQVAHAAVSLVEALTEQSVDLSAWKGMGSKKIVLQCENTEAMLDLKNSAVVRDLPYYLVVDAGLTEIESGSFTVLGIYGKSGLVDTVTGNLQTL